MAIIGPVTVLPNEALYSKNDVSVRIAKDEMGTGSLFITERAFIWKPDSRPEGISIPWTLVTLHAITNEPRSILMQLDIALEWPGVYPRAPVAPLVHANGDGHEHGNNNDQHEPIDEDIDEGNVSDSSDGDAGTTELHIVTQDANDINQIYYAMNHCQTMNPDPNDSVSDEDEDFMEAEGDDFNENDHGDMRNLHIGDDDDEQFADAE